MTSSKNERIYLFTIMHLHAPIEQCLMYLTSGNLRWSSDSLKMIEFICSSVPFHNIIHPHTKYKNFHNCPESRSQTHTHTHPHHHKSTKKSCCLYFTSTRWIQQTFMVLILIVWEIVICWKLSKNHSSAIPAFFTWVFINVQPWSLHFTVTMQKQGLGCPWNRTPVCHE